MQHTKKKTKQTFKSYLQPAMASMPLEGLCLDFGFDRKWDVSEQSPYVPFSCALQPRTSSVLPARAPLDSQQHHHHAPASSRAGANHHSFMEAHGHTDISLDLEGLLPLSVKKLKTSNLCIRCIIYKENFKLIQIFGSILWVINQIKQMNLISKAEFRLPDGAWVQPLIVEGLPPTLHREADVGSKKRDVRI